MGRDYRGGRDGGGYNDRGSSDRGYNNRSGGGGGGRRDGGYNREKFQAVCDDCGKNCEVPFKPTSGKPIYCDDCFSKHKPRDDRGGRDNGGRNYGRRDSKTYGDAKPAFNTNQYKEQFETLNAKLDKILSSLNLTGKKEVVENKVVVEKKTTKAEPKKTTKKKATKVKAKPKAKVKAKKKVAKKK